MNKPTLSMVGEAALVHVLPKQKQKTTALGIVVSLPIENAPIAQVICSSIEEVPEDAIIIVRPNCRTIVIDQVEYLWCSKDDIVCKMEK